MPEPMPPFMRSIQGDALEAVYYAARALEKAKRYEKNPYRATKADDTVDVLKLITRSLELYLGTKCPDVPETIDPFSALYGAALATGSTLLSGNLDWIEPHDYR